MAKRLCVTLCAFWIFAAPALFAEKVSLAIAYIPNIQFTPLYVGMEKGFYRDAGIELDIQYGFGMDIYSLLLTGKIDVGLADSDQLIIAGSRGMPLTAAFQYYQNYPVTIVARKGVVSTPADLAGKTIGVPEMFGTSYIGLQLFLDKYGLADKVKVEKIGYTQIPSLLAGKVAAAVCFVTNEPIRLRESGTDIVQWDVKDFSTVVSSSFISAKETIDKKRDTLDRFFAATRRAMEYTATHQSEAVTIAMKYIDGADESQRPYLRAALAATVDLTSSPSGFGSIDVARYRSSIQTLAQMKLIPTPYDPERIVTPLGTR